MHTKVLTGVQLKENKIPNPTESIYFNESKQQFFPADCFTYLPEEYHHVAKNIVGGRGISITVHDLFLWSRALHNHKLLSASTTQKMFVPSALKDTINKIYLFYGVLIGYTGKTDPPSPFQIDPLQTPFKFRTFRA